MNWIFSMNVSHAIQRRATSPRHTRQRGAFAVMTVVLVMVLLGFLGFAIDLGRMYHRKVELQGAADAIALAAARELDGTTAGVNRASNAAAQAAVKYYDYFSFIQWSDSAIRFGAIPDGSDWLDTATAGLPTKANTMFYARVDTDALAAQHGEVQMLLLQVFPSIGRTSRVSGRATAGRASTNVMPMAICAMSDEAGESRGALNELVEFGFRRGVSYDLMKLNPHGDAQGSSYLINPFILPSQGNTSVIGKLDIIRPFVCTGTVGIPIVPGSSVLFEENFPLQSVYEQLNSRFGSYTAPCVADTAPPDTNVKQYHYTTQFPAMDKVPTAQSAEMRKLGGRMITVADVPLTQMNQLVPPTTGGMYGPLWIFSRAVVKDIRYVSGSPEPATGYTKFVTADWPNLYAPDQKVKVGQAYPSTPYTVNIQAPVGVPGVALRRILYVPLLRCTATMGSSGVAEVRAVAKFFMTVMATEDALHAEFAGLVPHASLIRHVRLYP